MVTFRNTLTGVEWPVTDPEMCARLRADPVYVLADELDEDDATPATRKRGRPRKDSLT